MENLYHVPENGKAELVEGELRLMAPTGDGLSLTSENDYFASGTFVVRDVGILGGDVGRVYRLYDPETPTVYVRGAVPEADTAVPGRTMPMAELVE